MMDYNNKPKNHKEKLFQASKFLEFRNTRMKDAAGCDTSTIRDYPETKKFVRRIEIPQVEDYLLDILMVQSSQDFASLSLEYPLYSKEFMLIHELKELAPGIFRIYEMYVSHLGDKHYISLKFEAFKQGFFEKATNLVDKCLEN